MKLDTSFSRLGIDPVQLEDMSDSDGSSEDDSFQESDLPTLGESDQPTIGEGSLYSQKLKDLDNSSKIHERPTGTSNEYS